MKSLIILLIRIYQGTISPDHSWIAKFYPHGYCRFHPTCSEYTKLSVQEWGAFRGLFLGLARIMRCHPWSAWGIDPVIKQQL